MAKEFKFPESMRKKLAETWTTEGLLEVIEVANTGMLNMQDELDALREVARIADRIINPRDAGSPSELLREYDSARAKVTLP